MNLCEAQNEQVGQQMTDDLWELTEAQSHTVLCSCVIQVPNVREQEERRRL